MSDGPLLFSRRTLTAGLGATLLRPERGRAQPLITKPLPLTLRARPTTIALQPGLPQIDIWGLMLDPSGSGPAFDRGDEITVNFHNELPAPALLNWRGLDGNAGAEPLTARRPVAPGGSDSFVVAFRQAGALLCCARLLEQSGARPCAGRALIIRESEPVEADRDEALLIEDWRLSADRIALSPGADGGSTAAIYTVNGKTAPDITIRPNERARLRFINGCQRNVIAVKNDDHDVRVMAIDGQPAEPFLARNGQIILAPGSRVDVFIDAVTPGSVSAIILYDGARPQPIARLLTTANTPLRATPLPPPAPLPSNGLPAKLDLNSARRIELPLHPSPGAEPNWVAADSFTATQPVLRIERGRTVVAALINHAPAPVTFHLHGHHFRLLDRLDDGWRPFWLDTLAVDARQTQRIAFLAEHPGLWLMEMMGAEWPAPRLIMAYEIV